MTKQHSKQNFSLQAIVNEILVTQQNIQQQTQHKEFAFQQLKNINEYHKEQEELLKEIAKQNQDFYSKQDTNELNFRQKLNTLYKTIRTGRTYIHLHKKININNITEREFVKYNIAKAYFELGNMTYQNPQLQEKHFKNANYFSTKIIDVVGNAKINEKDARMLLDKANNLQQAIIKSKEYSAHKRLSRGKF